MGEITAYDMNNGITYIGVSNNEAVIKDFIMVTTMNLVEDKRAYNIVALEKYKEKNKCKKAEINLENVIASIELDE